MSRPETTQSQLRQPALLAFLPLCPSAQADSPPHQISHYEADDDHQYDPKDAEHLFRAGSHDELRLFLFKAIDFPCEVFKLLV